MERRKEEKGVLDAAAERPSTEPTEAGAEQGPDRYTRAQTRTARRLRFAGGVGSLCRARHLIADALVDAPVDVRDATVLLVGEIATNAVAHGGGWFQLEAQVSPDEVHVEVADASPDQPRVLRPSDRREDGRGMAIVDVMATRWGAHSRGAHKVVWFDLAFAG